MCTDRSMAHIVCMISKQKFWLFSSLSFCGNFVYFWSTVISFWSFLNVLFVILCSFTDCIYLFIYHVIVVIVYLFLISFVSCRSFFIYLWLLCVYSWMSCIPLNSDFYTIFHTETGELRGPSDKM